MMTIFWIQCPASPLQGCSPCCQRCCLWKWAEGRTEMWWKHKEKEKLDSLHNKRTQEQKDMFSEDWGANGKPRNNWFACRLSMERTCAGLLLCNITVYFFSYALYVLSRGLEWDVGVFEVCGSCWLGKDKQLCVMLACVWEWVWGRERERVWGREGESVRERVWGREGAYGYMWEGENIKYKFFVSVYRLQRIEFK